jgi:hypothetical protein
MTPTEAFVARENIARMRQQIEFETDDAARVTLRLLLAEQVEILRGGEAEEIRGELMPNAAGPESI